MFKKEVPNSHYLPPYKKYNRFNKINACLIALLALLLMSAAAFGQGGAASLSGTIQDASGGVLPGASVVVRNVDTGIETRATSNDRGIYNFPNLPVGTYELTADAAGFSRSTRSGIRLTVGATGRMDVSMAVAGTVTEIAVTGTVESVILEAGTSTGTVMSEDVIQSIPMVGNNVMDLINILGGVTMNTSDAVWGGLSQEFAGVNSRQVNITRDGMSMNELRYASGINSASNVNQEMVGEFKMVLSPVDAEMGRGAGQVQMTTRSGSNAFHGTATWSNQNTALDARDFYHKLNDTPKMWRNLNNYMLTGSGPIVKNKAFFFVTWEQQFSRSRTPVTAKVMTECAKKGIYRYVEGWQPGPATESNTFTPPPTSYTRPSVDMDGKILLGGTFYNSESNTPVSFDPAPLRYESVFGPLDRSASWWSQFIDPNNAQGVYGDCGVLPFRGMSGEFGTTSAWDTRDWGSGKAYHYQYDPTGFVDKFTNGVEGMMQMPPVNNWLIGDGLNYAGHRWTRAVTGEGGYQEGTGGDPDRKAVTFKLDYNINNEHRLSGTYSYEHHRIDDSWQTWPSEYGGYGGSMSRKPQSFLISLTSTLRPTLLNEFRFGLTRPYAMTDAPIDWNHRDAILEMMNALLPTGSGSPYFGGTSAQDLSILLGVGEGQAAFYNDNYGGIGSANTSHWYGGGYIRDSWGGFDPRWTTADTITWMKGAHSFKGGIEWRRQKSVQDATGTHAGPGTGGGSLSRYPLVFGGAITAVTERRRGVLGQYAPGGANDDGVSWRGLPPNAQDGGINNAQSTVYTTPYAMMTYFSGAISNTRQWFFQIPDKTADNNSRWNRLGDDEWLERSIYKNQEIHMFFKDDWRVTNDLTLNLGVRWEYYGVPHAEGGLSLGLVGGATVGAFGISEPNFDNWMKNRTYVKTAPGVRPDPVTKYQYIGPGSDHPDIMLFNRDLNNFAPHLGFSYQLPWFGKGLTVLRGGWSVSYGQINTFDQFATSLRVSGAAVPSYPANYGGHGDRFDINDTAYYMDITSLPSILPLNGELISDLFNVYPMRPFEVGRFGSSIAAHDENIRNPYTHNFNMSLTRNIGRSLTVDVRYIGTMSRKQIPSPSTFNLNQGNFLDNNLQHELEIVRAGGQSAVINSIVPTGTYVAGATLTGSDQLRATSSGTYSNLAAGAFNSVAATLATAAGLLPTSFAGEQGMVARSGCLPEDRTGYMDAFRANPNTLLQINDTTFPCQYGTPWNYFYTNPQNGTMWTYNATEGNYHSMQVQTTLRPTRGLSFQATYTWSRNLSTASWTNYMEDRDYGLGGQHRTHQLNTYGSYDLPLGANGFLFRDVSGIFKKAVEGWQLSWITAMSSGQPINASGASTMWGNSYSVLVRPDLWDEKGGRTSETWDGDKFIGGKYFGDQYMKVMDRGICNPNEMYGDIGAANTLYNQYCERIYQSSPGVYAYELRGSAPRALALASGRLDSSGSMIPERYSSLEEALRYDPNAQMDIVGVDPATGAPIYENPPIVVFRNANQIDYDGGKYIGNYKSGRVTGPGFLTFDMAMSKSIEFMEGKRLEFRVDAKNILNHATPTQYTSASYGGRFMSISAPSVAINGTGVFGSLPYKAGHRTFQARLSLRF